MRAPAGTWGLSSIAVAVALALGVLSRPAPASAEDDADRARAIALFEESAEDYRAGRFAHAAALLREAYALEPEPVLLYNLARALEGTGEDEEAIDAYERYLATGAGDDDADAARARLEVLRARVEERRRLEQQAQAAAHLGVDVPPPRTERARDDDPTPWILAGAGGAALAIGAVLGGLMLDRASVAEEAPIHETAARALADAQGLAVAADALFGVGGLLAGIGLVWGLVREASSPGPTATLRLGPGALSLRVEVP